MADLKTLANEMVKLKKQIDTVLCISGYHQCDDLSELDDWEQIKSADDRQKLEEYRNILYRIEKVQNILSYYDKPVKEISKLHLNVSGRYETNKGYYYTSGSGIEFLRIEEVYNYDKQEYEDTEIWTCSHVESENGKYYIVGYPSVELLGLTVRVRGN